MTKLASEEGRIWVRYDMLCHSENDNEVPLMTVTALNDPRNPIEVGLSWSAVKIQLSWVKDPLALAIYLTDCSSGK